NRVSGFSLTTKHERMGPIEEKKDSKSASVASYGIVPTKSVVDLLF
ncbi:9113_t:CDS:1, partial [Ambispora leptoticha]